MFWGMSISVLGSRFPTALEVEPVEVGNRIEERNCVEIAMLTILQKRRNRREKKFSLRSARKSKSVELQRYSFVLARRECKPLGEFASISQYPNKVESKDLMKRIWRLTV